MEELLQNIRSGFRSLGRRPGFSAVVLATLMLGIGMNTAIFSVLYGVIFQPLPFNEPDELVRVGRTRPEVADFLLPISIPRYVLLSEGLNSLEALEAQVGNAVLVGTGTEATLVRGMMVTPGMFDLLGITPAMGRTLRESDGVAGAESVVVLSHSFWSSRLGADPNIVGSTVELTRTPFTVIGVMPPEFDLGDALFWRPFQWDENDRQNRGNNFLRLYGRLAAGATVETATEELATRWAQIGELDPDTFDDSGMRAEPLLQYQVSRTRTPLLILSGAVGLVLLIACVNVANLMLAQGEARQREIAVRNALGAGRARIIRQFLTESMVMAFLGGLLGVVAAYGGVEALLAAFGSEIPRADEISISPVVLVFSLAVIVLTGILVGVAPALNATADPAALREGGRGTAGRVSQLQRGLVVFEVALALVLVTGAGLMLKSFYRATVTDLGVAEDNVLVANLFLPRDRYPEATQREVFMEQLRERLLARPQVTDVAMTNMVPIREFGNNITRLGVVGEPDRAASFVEMRWTTPTYFSAMGINVVRGRLFTEEEARDGASVAVINQELARQLFGDRDPLGKQLARGQGTEIVGVVSDVKQFGPDREIPPGFYMPTSMANNLVLRTGAAGATALAPILREAVRELDPNVPIYRIETMREIVDSSLGDRRFQLILLLLFAGVALTLGAVGIYGVLSFAVERQAREIGIRVALGAGRHQVLRMVFQRGGILVLTGIALGLGGAFAVKSLVESMLYDVSSTDPSVYLGVATVLILVAALATWVPARRAASVDPMVVLREE